LVSKNESEIDDGYVGRVTGGVDGWKKWCLSALATISVQMGVVVGCGRKLLFIGKK
jgi:hypothetical protein